MQVLAVTDTRVCEVGDIPYLICANLFSKCLVDESVHRLPRRRRQFPLLTVRVEGEFDPDDEVADAFFDTVRPVVEEDFDIA